MTNEKRESWLVDQLTKSEFFHQKLHEYGLLEIAYAIEAIQGENLEWDFVMLGISERAWNKIIHQGIKPVKVFAHPFILSSVPRSVGYYRGLSMVSLKSMGNVGLNIDAAEAGRGRNAGMLNQELALAAAKRLNELISRLIETDETIDPREFDLWRGMTAGATAQGSWQNKKGRAGEEIVKGFVQRRLEAVDALISQTELNDEANEPTEVFILQDGRTIRFSSEPDIAIYSQDNQIIGAVEVKGGIDPAAVLERIGASIKSLSRAKQQNPNAVTILMMYRVSMSPQALQELHAHQNDIDRWFTIEDVINKQEIREQIFALLNI